MERIQFPVRSFTDSLWNWHLASMWCQADNITESKGYSCLVTNNCICDDNVVVDRVENGDCNHHYYNKLKDAIRPTDQWERNWNWDLELDEWLECTQETKNVWECGGSSYQPWPWSLTEGGRILTKELLSRVPEKDKMLADRLFWNPRVADKILEIPVS